MIARDIDEVLSLLDGIIARFREQNSRLGYFAAMYRAVTRRVRAGIHAGAFVDGARMDRFDTLFANRYFEALDAFAAGAAPPSCWQVAFSVLNRPGVMILQHLVLGMNAHINYDLPISAAQAAPGAALYNLQGDFDAINAILAGLIDPVTAAVERCSPLLDVLDRVGGRTDEKLVNFSLVTARSEAWHEATRLADESEARRERSLASLDRRVALLAAHILLPGGLLGSAVDLIAVTETCDARDVIDALLEVQ